MAGRCCTSSASSGPRRSSEALYKVPLAAEKALFLASVARPGACRARESRWGGPSKASPAGPMASASGADLEAFGCVARAWLDAFEEQGAESPRGSLLAASAARSLFRSQKRQRRSRRSSS